MILTSVSSVLSCFGFAKEVKGTTTMTGVTHASKAGLKLLSNLPTVLRSRYRSISRSINPALISCSYANTHQKELRGFGRYHQDLSQSTCSVVRCFHSSSVSLLADKAFKPTELTMVEYEAIVSETLECLLEFFEDLPEEESCEEDYDAALGDGVLTVHLGSTEGTYVINKQTPNKQIWLSSPISGPKRYDYCDGHWIYLRDGIGLHTLLEEELSAMIGVKISLKNCKFYS